MTHIYQTNPEKKNSYFKIFETKNDAWIPFEEIYQWGKNMFLFSFF